MLRIKSIFIKIFVVLVLVSLITAPASAQQDEFQLGITRTFGYSMGNQIRGTFSIYVNGSGSIKSVQFLIDGKAFSSNTSAPFSVSFQTTSFSEGTHDLSAIVETTDGRKVTVGPRTFDFASAAQEGSAVTGILFPILGIVVGVLLLGVAAQVFLFRKKFATMPPGTARNYGFRGGAVCPRCHRPYAIHFWAMNVGLFTRLDRCDFCGKWAMVKPLSLDQLRSAEQNEVESFQNKTPIQEKTEEEKLREMLDKSKYSDQ